MTVINVGGIQTEDFVTIHRGEHGHEAEDLLDVGVLDVSSAEFDTVTITEGAQLTQDAALAFTPFADGVQIPGAEYRIGRQENFGDQTAGLLDGLNFKHTLDSEEQKINVQLHPSQPTIDIEGTKTGGSDWIRIVDSSSNTVIFSVHHDGSIQTPGWSSGSLPDAYHEGLAVQDHDL